METEKIVDKIFENMTVSEYRTAIYQDYNPLIKMLEGRLETIEVDAINSTDVSMVNIHLAKIGELKTAIEFIRLLNKVKDE